MNTKKIKIVFLYQVASFWPSWESLFYECINDELFDVKLVLLRESGTEKDQMASAETFLQKNNYEYYDFDEFDIESYNPQYIVYQTPYIGQRQGNMRSWSANMRRLGIKIVYIPYGIEIADTESADYAHFKTEVITNAFRIYTFSEEMKGYYDRRCMNNTAVRAFGLPRFDGLFMKNKFRLPEDVLSKANGRKIVLWKMHFPKTITVGNEKKQVSPNVNELVKFANNIDKYPELFFIYMPHPKMLDCDLNDYKEIVDIFSALNQKDNVYIDRSDDYRFSFLNSDAIIIDRSALMVEAGAVGCPVLFLHNDEYEEPFTEPVKRLVNSYYKGSCFNDIDAFLKMQISGEDDKKKYRDECFHKSIPYFDGQCGHRIKEDLIQSVSEEWLSSADKNTIRGKKIIVWGTGYIAKKMYYYLLFAEKKGYFTIVSYFDNDKEKRGMRFQNKNVASPEDISKYEFDYCLLAVQGKNKELHEQLNGLGIDDSRIINYDRFLVETIFDE